MDITQTKVDNLNAVLKITLGPEDYKSQYEDALKNFRKQMNLPGFRPGHVPMSVVKKQYGRSVLADEISKVLNDTITNHIKSNEIEILGNPLPKADESDAGNWDNPNEFKFEYELGLAPEFDIKLDKKKVTYYSIKVDDTLIDKQVVEMSKRYGSLSEPEESGENDLLMATLIELDENDEILEGGIMNDATVSLEFISDKKTKKQLLGLKKDDSVVVDPHKISKDHDDLGRMLNKTHSEVHDIKGNFKMNINGVKRLTPSVVDQSLFDKVYGKDEVTDLEEFRLKVSEELQRGFKGDQDWLFKKDLSTELIEKIDPELPDEFLKKWIGNMNEKPITDEQIEKDYPDYSKSLKWQLISGRIMKENNITVEFEEVKNYTRQAITSQYAQYGMPVDEENMEEYVKRAMGNREEVQRIYDMLSETKVVEFCKTAVKVKDKDVSYDDFVKMVNS
jgi:trigger factor